MRSEKLQDFANKKIKFKFRNGGGVGILVYQYQAESWAIMKPVWTGQPAARGDAIMLDDDMTDSIQALDEDMLELIYESQMAAIFPEGA